MTEKYHVIYADPPWSYQSKHTGGSMKSGSESHYPTLSPGYVSFLDVPSIAHPDSVCFLWITVPLLNEGFAVLSSWGFQYKTSLFWIKTGRIGMGHWFRGNVEVLLMGVRGSVKPFKLTERNHHEDKPAKHSAKPEYYYELIEKTGLTPRIELFARGKREGWDAHGLEVDSGVEVPWRGVLVP